MARKHKSWKQVIRQRLAEAVKEKTVSFGEGAHQASCQGLTVKWWWPKIKTLVIVKKIRKPLLTNY